MLSTVLLALIVTCFNGCQSSRIYDPATKSPWAPKDREAGLKGILDPQPWEADPRLAFPAWALCTESSQCVAVEGRCKEWDYVNRRFSLERAEANIKRRVATHCVDNQDYMQDAPEAACIHGVCAPARFEKITKEDCGEFRAHFDHVRFVGNRCEQHSDCTRGLDHCSLDCDFYTYPRHAEPVLAGWRDQFLATCQTCDKTCIDSTYYANTTYQPRCVQGQCVLRAVRTHFQEKVTVPGGPHKGYPAPWDR